MSSIDITIYPCEDGKALEKIVINADTSKKVSYIRRKVADFCEAEFDDIQLKYKPSGSCAVRYINDEEKISELGDITNITANFHSRQSVETPVKSLKEKSSHELYEMVQELEDQNRRIRERIQPQIDNERATLEDQLSSLRSTLFKENESHRSEVQKLNEAYTKTAERLWAKHKEAVRASEESHEQKMQKLEEERLNLDQTTESEALDDKRAQFATPNANGLPDKLI